MIGFRFDALLNQDFLIFFQRCQYFWCVCVCVQGQYIVVVFLSLFLFFSGGWGLRIVLSWVKKSWVIFLFISDEFVHIFSPILIIFLLIFCLYCVKISYYGYILF